MGGPGPAQIYQPRCGRRNPLGIHARIIGIPDNESQFGEFPWMVAVLRQDNDKLVFVCGASLIQPNVVMTAAHCVYGQNQLVTRLGEWDTQGTTELYPHQDVNVADVIIHEGYNHARQNLHNDIALLVLEQPAQLTNHIDTICLPDPNPQQRPLYGHGCFSHGWGKDSFESGQFQLVLKKVALPLVEPGRCQRELRKTRLGLSFRLDQSFTCAGGEGKDTCTGDGGSPLVCPHPHDSERFVLTGIVSWGIGCGKVGLPGVYVDVGYFQKWIDEKLRTIK